MTPGLVAVVGPLLDLNVPCFSQGGRHGYRQHFGTERYFVLDKKGWLRVPAGLVPRIVTFLHQQGYQVTVTDRTSWPQFEDIDTSLLETPGLESDDKAFLDAIHQNPRGQLHVRRQDNVERRIALLGEFHHKANIAIVTANLDQAKRLFGRLKQHTDRNLALSPEIDWEQGRTFICPAATFAMFAPRDWDVLIFVGVEAALGERVQQTLVGMDDQLRYVFVDQNAHIGPRTELRLEVFFGPMIFQQPNPYGAPAEVNVVLAACPGIKANKKLTGLKRKRACFWHNAARNRAVAEIATGFQQGNAAALAGYGVPSSAITDPGAEAQGQARVAVLVESTAHGEALLPLLPGWQLTHAVPGPGQDGDVGEDHAPVVTHATITTMVYAEKHGITADVLIRADGGNDWPLSAGSFPRRAVAEGDGVLVIDFADHVAGKLVGSVQHRIRAYERRGWHLLTHPGKAQAASAARPPAKRPASKTRTGKHS